MQPTGFTHVQKLKPINLHSLAPTHYGDFNSFESDYGGNSGVFTISVGSVKEVIVYIDCAPLSLTMYGLII